MSSIFDWSTTAGSNASSDSAINWAEGMAPSGVNNSSRAMMGRISEIIGDIGGTGTVGGTANGITLTPNSNVTALVDGLFVAFKATDSITGAATLNYNGLGSKAIRKMTSTGDAALIANEIRSGGIYFVHYSSAANSGAGAWLVMNPSLSGASLGLAAIATSGSASDLSTGTVPSARMTGNYTAVNSLTVTNTITGGLFSGNGSSLTDLSASALGSGTVPNARISGNYTGFASVTASNVVTAASFAGPNDAYLTTTGANTILLRPNGIGSSTGQFTVASSGLATVDGKLAANVGEFGSYSGTGATNGVSLAISSGGNILSSKATTSSIIHILFANSNGAVGSITTATNATAYNTSSDGRKKKNFRPFDAGPILDALEFGEFEWIADGKTAHGVIAQEAFKIFPEAIVIDDQGWYQADYAKFAPLFGSELRSLRRRVAAMEAQSSCHMHP